MNKLMTIRLSALCQLHNECNAADIMDVLVIGVLIST